MVNPNVKRAYKRFRGIAREMRNAAIEAGCERPDTCDQREASTCYAMAVASVRAYNLGLGVAMADEEEAWDGDAPAPTYLVWMRVRDDANRTYASLGMIGVNSMHDPYLEWCEGELLIEAIETIDQEADRKATALAIEQEARATYAGVTPG